MTHAVVTASTQESDTRLAGKSLAEQLKSAAAGMPIRGVVVYGGVGHDFELMSTVLGGSLAGAAVIGMSSCLGVGSGGAFLSGTSISALALAGDGFSFASALEHKGPKDHEATGRRLAERALDSAGLSAPQVGLAILHGTPGGEEAILRGVSSVLDKRTPIIGGSAADNDLSGQWRVLTENGCTADGVALALCTWPGKIATAYESGYLPMPYCGKVTRADGRTLYEIDNQPAAVVYNEWTNGAISNQLEVGGQVLSATTLAPLGISRASFTGLDLYVLLHPERVQVPERALTLFAEVKTGEEVVLMQSSTTALLKRASRVADRALRNVDAKADDIAGGLLIYCGGCLLAISDQAGDVMADFGKAVTAPTVSAFTFGEVGCVVPGQVDHANLMAGVALFTRG